jgi:S1-C subfamily serine protease
MRHRFQLILFAFYFFLPHTSQAGGWLGAAMQAPAGVQIAEIYKEGPADLAGLRKGDLLRLIDDQPIRSPEHLQEWLLQAPAGKEVTLTVWRRGEELRLKLVLENSAEHLPGSSHWYAPPADTLPPAAALRAPSAPRQQVQTPERADKTAPFPQERLRETSALPLPDEPTRPAPPSTWLGIASNSTSGGLAVMDVAPGSPAAQAELQKGDILIAVNRQAVSSPEGLSQILNRSRPGDWVEITYERNGRVRMDQLQLVRPPGNP